MKIIVYTIATMLVGAFGMVGWSIAGRMMTKGGDMEVLQGIAIFGGLIGLAATGASFGARKIVEIFEAKTEPSSESKNKNCCR